MADIIRDISKLPISVLDVKNPRLFCEFIDSDKPVRKVHVFSRPIKYSDGAELKPIVASFKTEADKQTVLENTVKFEANDNGSSRVAIGEYYIEYTPVCDIGTKTPTVALTLSDELLHENVWPKVGIKYKVLPGEVKETLVLEDSSTPDKYTYSYISNLTPVLANDGGIDWRDGAGTTILRTAPLVVWDSTKIVETELCATSPSANYELDSKANTLTIVVGSTWLDKAAYPVYIDPTTTTDQADCSANRYGLGVSDSKDAWGPAYIKFALPDLTGFTAITAATLEITQSVSTRTTSLSVNCHCDVVGAWDEASLIAVLTDLSFNAMTDNQTIAYSLDNVESLDVLGAIGTNGISEIYDNNTSPDPCTVKLLDAGWSSPTSASTGIMVGRKTNAAQRIFYARDNATKFPYIEITYTAGSTLRNPRQNSGIGGGGLIF